MTARRTLSHLGLPQVEALIQQERLSLAGAVFQYVVDPHEIYDFCFPIQPGKPSLSVDELADEQIALHDIFYDMAAPPLLLDEYVPEVQALTGYLERAVEKAYGSLDQLSRFVAVSGTEENLTQLKEAKDIDERVEALALSLNVILAVALGVYKFGVARWEDICRRRLLVGHYEGPAPRRSADEKVVLEVIDRCRGTSVGEEIYSRLTSGTLMGRGRAIRYRSEQASLRDAIVVDRILQIDKELEHLFIAGMLSRRYVFLYLSSATRSEIIFGLPVVRQNLPIINAEPTDVWRTRRQVFAALLHNTPSAKSPGERLRKFKGVLRKLKAYEQAADEIGGEQCKDCILAGGEGTPECKVRDLCRHLDSIDASLLDYRERVKNYSLLENLGKYRDLLRFPPRRGKFKEYVLVIDSLLDEPEVQGRAATQRELAEKLVAITSDFASTLLRNLARLDPDTVARSLYMRKGRDPVSATGQHLPTAPRIQDKRYYDIMEDVVDFFRTPPGGGGDKIELIRQACKNFLEVSNAVRGFSSAHELVRCYLFLALPSEQADAIAFQHACDMWGLARRLGQEDGLEWEYQYLICWAARRMRNYKDCAMWVDEAIRRNPLDARFYHGRALNSYSWHADGRRADAVPTEVTMLSAIEDCERAINLYSSEEPERTEERERNLEQVVSCYNDLACFWSFQLDSSAYDVVKAREALDRLKKLFDRDTSWYPDYPEYFHTEAYVEYKESLTPPPGRELDREYRISKLRYARGAIGKALMIFDKDDYRALRDLIDEGLSEYE